jgi:hypothetical protein
MGLEKNWNKKKKKERGALGWKISSMSKKDI